MKNNQILLQKQGVIDDLDKNKVSGLDDLSEILVREYLQRNMTEKNIALKNFICDIERKIILFTLGLTNGNQKNASRILGIKETSLCEKIKKYDLRNIKKKIALNLDMLNMDEEEISPDLFL
ncbi:MAG: helix-turn-helix domain-containing protein [Acidobacteriota bacterium]